MKYRISLLVLSCIGLYGCATTESCTQAISTDEVQRSTQDRLVVHVDAQGNITIDNDVVELNELASKVKTSRVILKASPQTPFSTVQNITGKLAEAGTTDVIFSAQK